MIKRHIKGFGAVMMFAVLLAVTVFLLPVSAEEDDALNVDNGIPVVYLDIDESQGTIQLLGLAGHIVDILEKGRVLIIDEFDTHLHPLLARRLVKMFHDPEENKNNAQLIFVTHNVSLLGKKLLDIDGLFRRDQIWFIKKDHQTQESKLYPLSCFKHEDDDMLYLDNDYLLGCYGAIPCLSD